MGRLRCFNYKTLLLLATNPPSPWLSGPMTHSPVEPWTRPSAYPHPPAAGLTPQGTPGSAALLPFAGAMQQVNIAAHLRKRKDGWEGREKWRSTCWSSEAILIQIHSKCVYRAKRWKEQSYTLYICTITNLFMPEPDFFFYLHLHSNDFGWTCVVMTTKTMASKHTYSECYYLHETIAELYVHILYHSI